MTDDEMLRQAIAHSRSLTRRRFLRNAGLGAGLMAAGPAFLAACGDDSKDSGSGGDSGGGQSETTTSKGSGTADNNDLYHANWTSYLDEESAGLWEKETGKKIFYSEEFNDNNEYFAKISPELSQGNPIKPDIFTPSFWMAGRLINLGWLEKLPIDQVPNAKNLVTSLVKPSWDPTGEYSLPWQSGMAGIAYNAKVTGREITSIDDVLDPEFKGKIGMLTEMRDTLGLLAMAQGVALDKPTFKAFEPVFEVLDQAVSDGQIRRFHGNDYMDDLSAGNFAMCFGWSGDVVQLAKANPDVKFVIPESGGTLWSDTMVVPKGATQVDNAASWMDFCYDPVNAARIAAFVQYISPVQGVQDELRKMGGDAAVAADSPLLFPDEATEALLQSWGNLDEEEEAKFDERFAEITGN